MHYSISIPNFGDYFPPQLVAELAHETEESGWDGFFVRDHVLLWNDGRLAMNDPWIALASVAMRTNRIRLGPLVTPIARRRPRKLARETTSLDHFSTMADSSACHMRLTSVCSITILRLLTPLGLRPRPPAGPSTIC